MKTITRRLFMLGVPAAAVAAGVSTTRARHHSPPIVTGPAPALWEDDFTTHPGYLLRTVLYEDGSKQCILEFIGPGRPAESLDSPTASPSLESAIAAYNIPPPVYPCATTVQAASLLYSAPQGQLFAGSNLPCSNGGTDNCGSDIRLVVQRQNPFDHTWWEVYDSKWKATTKPTCWTTAHPGMIYEPTNVGAHQARWMGRKPTDYSVQWVVILDFSVVV